MLTRTLPFLVLGSLVTAQQPANEAGPYAPPVPGPANQVDCKRIKTHFDVTATSGTADIRILGVANVADPLTNTYKWFFSGSNGGAAGPQKIYIYNSDSPVTNCPDAATVRNVNHAPGMVSAFWGHRDGEGYAYVGSQGPKAVAIFGDEGRNLFIMDAVTETWTGTTLNLASYGATTTRAVAVGPQTPAVPDPNIRIFVCDFSNMIEEWTVNLENTVTLADSGRRVANPGSAYGATFFTQNGIQYLAVHGQTAHACPQGVGLTVVTIYDVTVGPNYGTMVWSRAGDADIPGTAPNVAGGIAGGLQFARVNGQNVFAVLEQAVSDACGFVPFQGFAFSNPADCGGTLIVDGAPANGKTSGVRVVGAPAGSVCAVTFGPAPETGIPHPFNTACVLDTFPILQILALPASNAINFPIPPAVVGQVVLDGHCFQSRWTSTNSLRLTICPKAF